MAEVFIGIPTYRRPDMVKFAIDSLLKQTFTDWRCIVSDNPTPEKAGQKVEEFIEALDDPRIAFVQQDINAGEYGQGRFFLNSVENEAFFMILHDDDCLFPHYLEKAVPVLKEQPSASLFVANPRTLTMEGEPSTKIQNWYLKAHGRTAARKGYIDILSSLFQSGFVPISGTLFRFEDLIESGFVDADCEGNFPFEFNVLLRLGILRKQAWFDPEELLAFRFHEGSLRSNRLLESPNVVNTMIRLLERCAFDGSLERRRKVLLGRLFRARAAISLSESGNGGYLSNLKKSLHYNPVSVRSLCMFLLNSVSPSLVRMLAARPSRVALPPKDLT